MPRTERFFNNNINSQTPFGYMAVMTSNKNNVNVCYEQIKGGFELLTLPSITAKKETPL